MFTQRGNVIKQKGAMYAGFPRSVLRENSAGQGVDGGRSRSTVIFLDLAQCTLFRVIVFEIERPVLACYGKTVCL